MLQRGLTPPFGCQNVIYGGDTVGGRGYYMRDSPMPLSRGGSQVLIILFSKILNGLFDDVKNNHYLCIDSVVDRHASGVRDRGRAGGETPLGV